MKRFYMALVATMLCSNMAVAQFQVLMSTARRVYDDTKLELADTAYLFYKGSPHLLTDIDKWNYDTAWHYNKAGNYIKRESRTKNSKGQIITILEETNTGSTWQPLAFWRYEYDAVGWIENIVWYDWGGVPDSMRTHYTRNMQGKVTERLEQNWDAANSQWVDAQRYTYTYNINKQELMVLREDWDVANSQWNDFLRIANTWVANQKVLQVQSLYINNNWEYDKQNEYTYDANNKLVSDESSSWNGTGWDKFNNINYSYDTHGRDSEAIHQSWDGAQYINLYRYACEYNLAINAIITRKTTWDINTGTFVYKPGDEETRDYYQWEGAVHDAAKNAATMHVYPIPAKNHLRIQAMVKNSYTAKIYMVDINGRTVKTQNIPAANGHVDAFVDIQGMPAGIYTLTLDAGGSIVTKKVVVQ